MKLKVLSDNAKAAIEAEFPKYPDKRSVLLPALRIVQEELGYLSEPAMIDVADLLELTPIQVYDVATFYTQYNLKPVGRYLIQVCKTLSCALVGAGSIIEHLQQRLGIKVGGTTPDGLFTLKLVECLAACGSAPMMQINDRYYEQLTTEKVDRILEDLKRDGRSPLATGPFMLPVMGEKAGEKL
ncbi:MAG: NADH-quinone oxidoreductase subunit NuoE [Nitrospiria bacterium]